MGGEISQFQFTGAVRLDDRADPFAKPGVGNPHHNGVPDVRMSLQSLLDLLGEDLLSAGVDAL